MAGTHTYTCFVVYVFVNKDMDRRRSAINMFDGGWMSVDECGWGDGTVHQITVSVIVIK